MEKKTIFNLAFFVVFAFTSGPCGCVSDSEWQRE